MAIDVIRGATLNPAASEDLIDALVKNVDISGILYIGYPLIGSVNSTKAIDALFVSRNHGVVAFDLSEETEPGDFEDRQNHLANHLDVLFRSHDGMTQGLKLRFPIHAVTYNARQLYSDTNIESVCANAEDLQSQFQKFTVEPLKGTLYKGMLSILQDAWHINNSTKRETINPQSKGTKLKLIEDSIATFDIKQSRALIETYDGIQRIRGLAGSGKSVILAHKAVYLHAIHPEWRIAITFHNRNLREYFHSLIKQLYLQKTKRNPNWENLRIVNPWGSTSDHQKGLYLEMCERCGIPHMTYSDARAAALDEDPFAYACKHALKNAPHANIYDAILVDEAQDLPPDFMRLCRALLKPPQRLVFAYDELQNLSKESLPPPEEIFGKDTKGQPNVTLDKKEQNHTLNICYRTPSKVLTTAHAIGFGVYRTPRLNESTGLVQIFDNPKLWRDLGYSITEGTFSPGETVRLRSNAELHQESVEIHVDSNELIQLHKFDSEDEQDAWLINAIQSNLSEDELRPKDIMVIHPEASITLKRTAALRSQLFELGIDAYLVGNVGYADMFHPSDSALLISSIHRVKGIEAAMVYVMDAHLCVTGITELAEHRNRLYSAMTRSKAWVRISGIGEGMQKLEEEYQELRANNFDLVFNYPNDTEHGVLRRAFRNRSSREKSTVEVANENLDSVYTKLRNSEIDPSDLDPYILEKFQNEIAPKG